jgi:hypothetical protein
MPAQRLHREAQCVPTSVRALGAGRGTANDTLLSAASSPILRFGRYHGVLHAASNWWRDGLTLTDLHGAAGKPTDGTEVSAQ